MKRKVLIILITLFMVIASLFGCIRTELYREIFYDDLSDEIKQWADGVREKEKFGIYRINEDNYYFMYSVKEEPLIFVKTIIVQGNDINIYLEDKNSWNEDGKDFYMLRLTLPKGINNISVIYNGEPVAIK
jgi:hypothetical protein